MTNTRAGATRIAILATVALGAVPSWAQMAKTASKYVGNITTDNAVRSDFGRYWNQVSPENEGKWGVVESNRGTFNWSGMLGVKKYANDNKIPYKFHCLVWGSQQPSWITNLSQADQLTEINKWFDDAAAKFPDAAMIDVVNEAYPGVNGSGAHAPAPYKAALGGDGASGFDWIFEAFRMARKRWPNAVLIYNDYNNLEYGNERAWTLKLAKAAVAAKVPMDAIGCQAHDLDEEGYRKLMTGTELKTNIDELATAGLPIFITEYDISETDDAKQKTIYMDQFPVMWNHPKVAGVTIWGYIVGKTWSQAPNSGLVTAAGAERPAMVWLKDYLTTNQTPASDFQPMIDKVMGKSVGVASRKPEITTTATGLTVRNIDGHLRTGVVREGRFQVLSAIGSN